jgi:hypothetical protein
MSTGITLMEYAIDERPTITAQWHLEGGYDAVTAFFEEYFPLDEYQRINDEFVYERFTPRPVAFSYSLDELEPLRIEGFLAYYISRLDCRVAVQDPGQRKLLRTLPETEKFLQANNYWATGTDVGCKDANDANSATMHALAFIRNQAHRATIDMLIEYGENMTEELV